MVVGELDQDAKLAFAVMELTAQMRLEELARKGRFYETLQACVSANPPDAVILSDGEVEVDVLLDVLKVGLFMCEILHSAGIEEDRIRALSVGEVIELERAIGAILGGRRI